MPREYITRFLLHLIIRTSKLFWDRDGYARFDLILPTFFGCDFELHPVLVTVT